MLIKTYDSSYKVGHKQFEILDSKELLYFLGFIWADGSVLKNSRGIYSRFTMHLISSDMKELIEIFNKIGNWNYYIRKLKGRQEQTSIFTSNRYLCEQLIKYNFANKNIGASFINDLDIELQKYFMLGFVDGDGCFFGKYYLKSGFNKSFNLSSTFDQNWEFVENILNFLNIEYSIVRKKSDKSSFSRLVIQKWVSLLKFGNWLYSDFEINKIGLERKRNIFLNIETYHDNILNKRKSISTNILEFYN